MISLGRIAVYLVLIGVCVYTASYGLWTWNRKNRLGAVMIFAVALALLIFPMVAFYLRR